MADRLLIYQAKVGPVDSVFAESVGADKFGPSVGRPAVRQPVTRGSLFVGPVGTTYAETVSADRWLPSALTPCRPRPTRRGTAWAGPVFPVTPDEVLTLDKWAGSPGGRAVGHPTLPGSVALLAYFAAETVQPDKWAAGPPARGPSALTARAAGAEAPRVPPATPDGLTYTSTGRAASVVPTARAGSAYGGEPTLYTTPPLGWLQPCVGWVPAFPPKHVAGVAGLGEPILTSTFPPGYAAAWWRCPAGGRTWMAPSGGRTWRAQAVATFAGTIDKAPYDEVWLEFDFGDVPEIQAGGSFDQVDVPAVAGLTIDSVGAVNAYRIGAWYRGGTEGESYDVECRVVLDDGTKVGRTGTLRVGTKIT